MQEKYSSFKASLKGENLIEIFIAKSYNWKGCQKFFLYDDAELICELKIENKNETPKGYIYQIKDFPTLKLGRNYEIYDERNIVFPLDCSLLLRLDRYVGRLKYDGELGAIYSKESTTFRIFAPLANTVYVSVKDNEGKRNILVLNKDEKTGVFEGTMNGDLDGYSYRYLAKVNCEYRELVDPYAKGLTLNSVRGVIVNPEKVKVDQHNECLPKFDKITDAIIYETSVRDLTSDPSIKVKNKGKYAGFYERGVRTKNGFPVGIDYIRSLGVTHVQLLPVFDFCTTNDLNPKDTYNWGYDPLNYNCPEGSMATDPSNPYARIIELKTLISELHKDGIRVVMDVVYNHVFNLEESNFEKICPQYYFRYNHDGTKSDGSFCGSEFESRHPMSRKFIVDSCKYWVKEYGFDGLRFDLMGLIDWETMNEVVQECKKIKPEFICYGEGWDMPSVMPNAQKASMNNAHMTPDVGYFNDRFRDIVKGKTSESELYVKGYLSGDTNYVDGFKHCMTGCTQPIAFPPLFGQPSQSINYVECHDNHTLFDKLKVCCYDEDLESRFKRIKLINAITLFSYGVPFFHMGQEIGLTKNGHGNTYNAGDKLNQFDYDVLDQRSSLYYYFKDIIQIKKEFACLRLSTKEEIGKAMSFSYEANGCVSVKINEIEFIAPYKDVRLYINPTKNSLSVDLDDYYQVILNESGRLITPFYSQHLLVNGLSCVLVVKK